MVKPYKIIEHQGARIILFWRQACSPDEPDRLARAPEGFIYILEVDGETAGTGRLSKLEDGICELNNMYIRPKFRGMGLRKEMLNQLEEKVGEFGYSTLRLDTSPEYMPAAVHIYRRAGFKERGPYSSQQRVATYDSENGSKYYRMKTYMEKELKTIFPNTIFFTRISV